MLYDGCSQTFIVNTAFLQVMKLVTTDLENRFGDVGELVEGALILSLRL